MPFRRTIFQHGKNIEIVDVIQLDAEFVVEIDEYVPLRVRTYSYSPGIGASWLRLGNYKQSLVEMPIDPKTGIIRGFDLVLFDLCGERSEFEAADTQPGLPQIDLRTFGDTRYVDHTRDFFVSMSAGKLFVDWSNGSRIEKRYNYRGLSFYAGNGSLLAASIENLSPQQISVLQGHIEEKRARLEVSAN